VRARLRDRRSHDAPRLAASRRDARPGGREDRLRARDPRRPADHARADVRGADAPGALVVIHTRLCDLFGIRVPVIQTGMGWVSGARLTAATSAAGALGILGSATMTVPELEA